MERNITATELRTSYSYNTALRNLIISTAFVLVLPCCFYWLFGVKYSLSGFLVIMPFLCFFMVLVIMLVAVYKFIKLRIAPQDYVLYSAVCVPGEWRLRHNKSSYWGSYVILDICISFIDETGKKHLHGESINVWRSSISSGCFNYNEVKISIGYDKKRERYLIFSDMDAIYHC